jgi:hypothetical protein
MTPAEARAQLDAHRATCAKALFRCAACVRADDVLARERMRLIVIDDLVPDEPRDSAWHEGAGRWSNRLQERAPGAGNTS